MDIVVFSDANLGLNDLIILGEKKSESDHTIAVDSNGKNAIFNFI